MYSKHCGSCMQPKHSLGAYIGNNSPAWQFTSRCALPSTRKTCQSRPWKKEIETLNNFNFMILDFFVSLKFWTNCKAYLSSNFAEPSLSRTQENLAQLLRPGAFTIYISLSFVQLINLTVICYSFMMIFLTLVSSVRSSNSHPDLLLIQHPTFSDHTGPQHWTFTFWATTAI